MKCTFWPTGSCSLHFLTHLMNKNIMKEEAYTTQIKCNKMTTHMSVSPHPFPPCISVVSSNNETLNRIKTHIYLYKTKFVKFPL